MAKKQREEKEYTVTIKRVEYYSYSVIVKAKTKKEALEKLDKKWQEDDYLYEKLTDCMDDARTRFICNSPATEQDKTYFPDLSDL